MLALKEQYKRLNAHGNTLPRDEQINCPVFSQDKFDYLKLIPEFVNPTIKIEIKESYSKEEWEQIVAFWQVYCLVSGAVIKAPFTTNRYWLTYPKVIYKEKNKVSIEGTLLKAFRELNGHIPYVMMQPCIDNEHKKREKKVVFMQGKASHITTGFSVGSGFPYSDEEVIIFAQNAYDALRERLGPNHWLDQLCRVDVMYNEFENRMVVNEFESLMACFQMKADADFRYDLMVENFLKDYFIKKLEELVINKLEDRIVHSRK